MGQKKITLALKQKDISDYCIKKGLQEIDEEEYIKTLTSLIEKTHTKYHKFDSYQRNSKTAQYIIGRGFESQLVWEHLKYYTND